MSLQSAATAAAPLQSYLPHFETGIYQHAVTAAAHTRLPDAAYGLALDTFVKCCNDIVLIDERDNRVLMGNRNMYPQRDWWFGCGGRMRAGESVASCVQRLLKRELGINITATALSSRIQVVGTYSFLWRMREQQPQSNGTADLSCVLALTLTAAEIATIEQSEYESIAWLSISNILNGSYHSAVQRVLYDYIGLMMKHELQQLTINSNRVLLRPCTVNIHHKQHYAVNNAAVDVAATQQHFGTLSLTQAATAATEPLLSAAAANTSTAAVTAQEIADATIEFMRYSHWLQQHDNRLIVAVEK